MQPGQSPKLQFHDVAPPVEVSVKAARRPAVCTAKSAAGGVPSVTKWLPVAFTPAPFAIVSVTGNEPLCVYVCDGFCVAISCPSPKSHCHATGLPVDVSVKSAVRPRTSAVNDTVI